MQPDPVAGGNRPVLSGAEILARSPGVAEVADVEAIDWGLVPASHLSFRAGVRHRAGGQRTDREARHRRRGGRTGH